MVAVLEIWGKQYIVKKGDVIDVDHQDQEVGSTITVNPLLISDEAWKKTKIWTPTLEGSKVELKVLDQFKWDKVRVFKMKSKKRYSRSVGFRAQRTSLEVVEIA